MPLNIWASGYSVYRADQPFFFSSRRRHTRCSRDWSSDVCSSDLLSFFGAVDQERAFGFERAKLGRVAEPPAGVNLRRSRMVSDSFGLHISETGSAKPFAPFRCGEQVCFDREQTAPLMSMRIVAIVVDEDPSRAAGLQHPEDFANAGDRIGPVISRFDGNDMREKIRLPGNLLYFAGDED